MDTPKNVLRGLVDSTRAAADYSARPGAGAATNTDDTESFPSLSARERANELDGEAD